MTLAPDQMTLEQLIAARRAGQLSDAQALEAMAALRARALRLPLSEAQRGLWSLQKAMPDHAGYNVPMDLRVDDPAQRRVLPQALEALNRHWPLLGARVAVEGSRPVLILDEAGLPVERGDGSSWTPEERSVWLKARLRRPFDPARGFARAVVLEDGEGATLLLVLHHLIFDGISVAHLVESLRAILEALAAGQPLPAAPGLEGYRVFLERERASLEGTEGERRRAHWREELANLPGPLDLSPDRAGGAESSHEAHVRMTYAPEGMAARIKAFASDSGLFPSTIMLGIWQALLARLAGVEDLVVGMPVNRRCPEARDLVGMFIDMMPLRLRGLDLPGRECLAGLQRRLLNGMGNILPFPDLVRAVGVTGLTPVFQVSFLFQDFVRPLAWGPQGNFHQEGEYDLVLEVVASAERVGLKLKYDPALYDDAFAEEVLARYVTLLDGLLASPETPLSELSLLSAAERLELLEARNATDRAYVLDPLPELIARQVARVPEAPAVSGPERSFTYAELDRLSAGLARRLIAKGVTKGATVGLCLDRTPWMVVGLLGILRAGAAYVPLDPAYPRERLDYMLSDAGAQVVVGDGSGPFGDVMPVDGPIPEETTPLPSLDGEDLAYILYTSGSTGNPKGVMIPHRALSNFLQSMAEDLSMTERDRLLAVTTVCFDIAGLELFLPLTLGAEVIVCPAEVAKDGRGLKEHLAKLRPTVMQATPATWTMLFHAGWTNAEGLKVLCGGEALPASLKARFDDVKTPVWNLFGPTETTIWSTVARLGPGDPITIGKPLANTRIYVLDGKGQPVPEGVTGELYIGGSGVALGYRNLPERTDLVFRPDPFHGGMMYNTGDLARWRSDGSLDFLGRADQQVKIRGYRVEPGEIEARLDSHPTVARSAVVAQATAHGARLVAWVVPGAGARIEVEALKAHLSQTLPPYMVPEVYSTLEALPLTNNNKVDRKTLMAREPVLVQAAPAATGGADALQARLTALWEEVLEVKGIGPTDGFFAAGGDSVSAVLMSERLTETFGHAVSVTDLFRYPTIRGLTEHLTKAGVTVGAPEPEPTPTVATSTTPVAQPAPGDGDLAIIGISCRFPGAEDHWTFWENLRSGKDTARWYTPDELRAIGLEEEVIVSPGYVPVQRDLDGKNRFDSAFFGMAPRNAALMDPQARQLLQASWAAMEDAGYRPEDMMDTGVFMSTGGANVSPLLLENYRSYNPGGSEVYLAWLLTQSGTMATTIAHQLGLRGPAYSVHANCSSSLVGLHAAARAIAAGDATQALVGATTLKPDGGPIGYLYEPGLNFSSTGGCRTFDAKADGMVVGEGVVVILVKSARKAIADGDHIYALIKGIALNNDGSDKAGYYAPSVRGQAEVITKALTESGVDPSTIGLMEAHGTGTTLGDPIEVAGLTEAWGAFTDKRQYCALGAVKSNVGHLDTAAGLAGLTKVALSLYHGEVPPTLNYDTPNPKIDFAATPFVVADSLRPWPDIPGPRRGAVSAFGIGGTNAHAILEQAPPRAASAVVPGPHRLTLSAKRADRLPLMAGRLAEALETRPDLALVDVAHTLALGRQDLSHALSMTVSDRAEALAALRAYAEGRGLPEGLAERADAPDPASRGRRVSLPSYPFKPTEMVLKERIVGRTLETHLRHALTEAAKHPLVHGNSSTLEGTRFTSAFSGNEAVFTDHVMGGAKILPGVAYLEMARAAYTLATDGLNVDDPRGPAITDVVWVSPLIVDGVREVHISLEADGAGAVFEVWTRPEVEAEEDGDVPVAPTGERIVHCQGRIAPPMEGSATSEVLNLDALAARMTKGEESGEALYDLFARHGAAYGTAFRCVSRLSLGEGEALGRMVARGKAFDAMVLSPGLLDGAVQVAFRALDRARGVEGGEGGSLPFELGRVEMHAPLAREIAVWARPSPGNSAGGRVQRMDVDLCDDTGRVLVSLRGLARLVEGAGQAAPPSPLSKPRPAPKRGEARLARPRWRPVVVGQAFAGPVVTLSAERDLKGSDFTDRALDLMDRLRTLVKEGADGTLVQVIVPDRGPGASLRALAGLAHVLPHEHPRLGLQINVLEAGVEPETALAAARSAPSEPLLRHGTDGTLQALDLNGGTPVDWEVPTPWRVGGVYVISGGLGGLGRILAREILETAEDSRVVLLGRSPLDDTARGHLAALGDRAEYHALDITDAPALEALIAGVTSRLGAPVGVLHCAGALDDGLLIAKDPARARAVLAPKVAGTEALDAATAHLDLDLFVLYSSVSALGALGQSDYALANAYLDAFAAERAEQVARGERRGRTLSIAWPLWREGRMRPAAALSAKAPELDSAEGMACLRAALAQDAPWLVVPPPGMAPAEPPRFQADDVAPPPPAIAAPVERAAAPDPSALTARALVLVGRMVADLVGAEAGDLDPEEEFSTFGLDSIALTNLAGLVNDSLKIRVTPAIFFEHPTLAGFVGHLVADRAEALRAKWPELARAPEPAPAPAPVSEAQPQPEPAPALQAAPAAPVVTAPVPVREAEPEAIAIIGMSGRFPQAPDLEAYWENLIEGRDCVTEVPGDRWDWRAVYGDPQTEDNRTDIKWGAFMEGVADFDPLFFGLSPAEAEGMDPHQRLLLLHAWNALEDAGQTKTALSDRSVGLFVGLGMSDYGERVARAGGVQGHTLMGLLPSMAPSRMSHFMNWHGPSEFIDTACSSSLVALHRAARAIAAGDCEMALAGGVMVMLSPTAHIGFSKAGMLAKDGHCKTFSEAADGYVRGEGVGMVVLKPLSKAQADGDPILAILRGSAVNHGGRANTLTSPNPTAQAALIKEALSRSGTDPRDVSYVEAHGTGTKLGDPIEVNGLKMAFRDLMGEGAATSSAPWCALGSAKTNIGHLEIAAGIAGVIKVLLQMRHGQLAPSLHGTPINPYLELEGSPFDLVSSARPWTPPAGKSRIAGVSSFGFGGVNAHVVLEEYREPSTEVMVEAGAPQLIVLSGRTESALMGRVRDLARVLEDRDRGAVSPVAVPLDRLTACLAAALEVPEDELDPSDSFDDLGLDPMGRERLRAILVDAALPGVDPEAVARAQYLADFHTAFAEAPTASAISLAAVARTLRLGREPMEHRLAFTAETLAGLRETLGRLLQGGGAVPGVHRGQVRGGKDSLSALSVDEDMGVTVAAWVAKGKQDLMARLWVQGMDLPWAALDGAHPPAKLRLPGYAFDLRRCWVEEGEASVPAPIQVEAPRVAVSSAQSHAHTLVPLWEAIDPPRVTLEAGPVFVAGVGSLSLPGATALSLEGDLAGRLSTLPGDAHIVFQAEEGIAWDAPAAAQGAPVRALFRLTKALVASGRAMGGLSLTLVTRQALDRGDGRAVRPAGAACHGLLGALAKEYPHWRVRALDLTEDEAIAWADIAGLAPSGETLIRRDGQWFRAVPRPLEASASDKTPYRDGGVYLVLGGAGGIGEAWSRHVITAHGARVVWLGRRPLDARIQGKIDALAKLGPAPVYLQVDATDPEALSKALSSLAEIHGREYGRIHGVIHSALVLRDRSLATMDEGDLTAALGAKLDASLALARVLDPAELDFLAFFSSTMAFGGAAGQGNYAAGCAYQDSLAHALGAAWPCPVKVMNWGWWGSLGVVSDPAHRARMEASGARSIEPEEGFAAFDRLLGGPLAQVAFLKTERPWEGAAPATLLDGPAPDLFARLAAPRPGTDGPTEAPAFPDAALEGPLLDYLAAQVDSVRGNADPAFAPWLAETARRLNGRPAPDVAGAKAAWTALRAARGEDPALTLLDRCLTALPDVLRGRIKATEVLFPEASMELVEAIYRGNPLADLFNGALTDMVVDAVRARLAQDPGAKLRILEVGAGTGGTTRGLVAALAPLSAHIAEYRFTDLSKAFLLRAEEVFGPDCPALATALFDVERPPAAQGLATGAYDLVVATNVLHATRDIRTALAHVKACLRPKGLVLINEITGVSLFTHLTFGLLEGWWRFTDPGMRLPGGPALSVAGWTRALRGEGYPRVAFPLSDRAALDQQIILAESDGLVVDAGEVSAPQAAPRSSAKPQRKPQPVPVSSETDVAGVVRSELVRLLKVEPGDIEAEVPFSDYGVDSILGVGFVKGVGDRLGLSLNTTVLFDHTTLARLVSHLVEDLGASVPAPSPPEPETAPLPLADPVPLAAAAPQPTAVTPAPSRVSSGTGEIAILGMACMVPGAVDVDGFWEDLMAGRDGVGDLPADYRDTAEAYYAWGGTLSERACFDPRFFNISPREAKSMSPHQRLIMQEGWKALEDAAIDPRALANGRVGCYVGAEPAGYFHETFTGASDAIIASRLSYFLNLKGPTLVVNTGCSSSGTALHLACETLRRGEADMMLAGGVYANLSESGLASLAQLDMLSSTGRCHSFDAAADGTVFSEAVGMVVLKRLEDARRDGDPIRAVITASGANQDGASNGLTAPSGAAQERLITETYERFGVDPGAIGYVETHGTGTPLGDPVEANALIRAYRKGTDRVAHCALGSAKAHIGHAGAGAGIISLIKAALSVERGRLPGLLHFKTLNPLIELEGSPFHIPTRAAEWAAEHRLAAMNSFGHSGSNVHLVLRNEPPAVSSNPDNGAVQALLLSAVNGERLGVLAGRLADHLDARSAIALGDLAHSLCHGRTALKERACLFARTRAEAVAELRALAATQPSATGRVVGRVEDEARAEGKPRASEALLDLALAWARGVEVDWPLEALGGVAARRVPLPPYPFVRTPFWRTAAPGLAGPAAPLAPAAERLHPLLHRALPGLDGQAFQTRLTGREEVLRDHAILGKGTLPGVAYLEMARAALELGDPQTEGRAITRLSGVVWRRPIADAPLTVTTKLTPAEGGRLRFEVTSVKGEEGDAPKVHCQGMIARVAPDPMAVRDLAALKARFPTPPREAEAVYAAFDGVGIHYGPTHRGIRALWTGAEGALARLELDPQPGHLLPPGLMDSAAQATLGVQVAAGGTDGGAHVPFSLARLDILAPLEGSGPHWANVTLTKSGPTREYDIEVLDDSGRVLVRMEGFAFLPAQREAGVPKGGSQTPDEAPLLWRPWWLAAAAPEGEPARRVERIVLSDRSGLALSLPGARVWEFDGANPAMGEWLTTLSGDLLDLARETAQGAEGGSLLQVIVPSLGAGALLAGLSGLLRTVALESPRLSTQLIEVDGAQGLEALARAEAVLPAAVHVRHRKGRRELPHWAEVLAPVAPPPVPWRDNGVYLITGGLGGLGLIVARAIAKSTSRVTLVLVGRSTVSAEDPRLGDLRALGATVEYQTLDVSDERAVRAVVEGILSRQGALHGVIHGAGVLRDGYLRGKTRADLEAVFAPKVGGALALDRATAQVDLDVFVLFAAGAGAWGNPGQADYAAANAILDAFAAHRQTRVDRGERRGRTVALDWPLWANGGMTVDAATAEAFHRASGATPLSDGQGVEALTRALLGAETRVLVAGGDRARLLSWMEGLDPSRSKGPSAESVPAATKVEAEPAPVVQGPPKGTRAKLRGLLVGAVAEILELDPGDVDPREDLTDLGFDSITFTELTNRVNTTFGLDLVPTVFFEFPTVDKVSAFLMEDHASALSALTGPAEAEAEVEAECPVLVAPEAIPEGDSLVAPTDPDGAVAIVGMSGAFPGAPDLEAFWEVLAEGRDMITEVPPDRWDWRALWGDPLKEEGKTNVKWGGFVEDMAAFDPLFFGISPREAEGMDPQQRLFLTHAWLAIEDAGIAPSSLSGGETGVFVGTAASGYATRMALAGKAAGGHSSTGAVASVGPNRLSFMLDLHGPSEPVETACSSALVAIHRAMEAIRSGRCETALAGGVNCIVLPDVHISFNQAGMLSPDGRCKTFSKDADGYGRGEGVGMVLLKDLRAALRDGDVIRGVLRGSAVNHGGRAGSLTAPNPKAQAALVRAAIQDAGVDPASISYVECHGTGTELGDPIEVQGLTEAFSTLQRERGRAPSEGASVALGSVKTNIGHLELAAGVAGVMKVVLQMERGQLAPSLHAAEPNPYIRLDNTPFRLTRDLEPWEPGAMGGPRRAGVSSFGFGGVNAHVVLEEAPPVAETRGPVLWPQLILLSAKTRDRLATLAGRLRVVMAGADAPRADDMAHTLRLGRDAMEERVAFQARSPDHLLGVLGALAQGGLPEDVLHGRVRHDAEVLSLFETEAERRATVAGWLGEGQVDKVTRLWVAGLPVDWSDLPLASPARKVRLPGSPMAQDRYWVDLPSPLSGETVVDLDRQGPEETSEDLLDRVLSGDLSPEEAARLARTARGA